MEEVNRIGVVLIGTVEQTKKVFATNGRGEHNSMDAADRTVER